MSSLHEDTPEVGAELIARDSPDDHVISLGSGPDLFRPQYVFPLAEHLHLVELGNGWAGGFAALFAEIEARLANLGPGARVERIREGFLKQRPPPHFASRVIIRGQSQMVGPWRDVRGEWQFFARPCVWRVTWTDALGESMRRFVYLHVGDISNLAFARAVLKTTRGRLGGLFLSGLGLPTRPALDAYLDELRPGGLFYVGLDYVRAEGVPQTYSEHEAESEAYLKERLSVALRLPTPAAQISAHPQLYWPTFHLFEKPR